MFHPTALIGIYDHGETIAGVVEPLRALKLPCRIVDDGSCAATKTKLAELVRRFDDVVVRTLPQNAGRGAALTHGFEWIHAEGFTHAVTIDADGQHDTDDVPAFLGLAEAHPDALVLGSPRYGADAPIARVWGRKLSRFWVHVETLSRAIDDPLCGFRCYPVRATCDLLGQARIGARMDFDPEIAVRLMWSGMPIVNLRTHVRYPPGGISHFRAMRDNARISWMHTRLCCEMLLRMPRVLALRGRMRLDAER